MPPPAKSTIRRTTPDRISIRARSKVPMGCWTRASAWVRRTASGRWNSGAPISPTSSTTRWPSMRRSNTTRSTRSSAIREPGASPLERNSSPDMTKTQSRAFYALFVLFVVNLLNCFDRQLPGALAEPIRKEFHLSDTSLGLLGTIATLMYAVVGLPLGRLADKWYRTRLIAAGTAVWSVLTAMSGLAQNYLQLFVSRLGVGLGEATCAPAGQSLIGDLFPPVQRARAMGVFMLGLPIGLFLAFLSVPFIAPSYGWRAVFLFALLPGLLLAVAALFMHEPVRGALDPIRKAATAAMVPRSPTSPWTILSLPTMWWIIASGVLHNFNMYTIGAFQAPLLQRYHEMSLRNASLVSSVSAGLIGAVGLLVGGYLADKMSAKRRNGRLLLAAWAM